MVDAIERQEQMRTLEKRYRNFDRAWKMPTTWLNGKNWEDEVNLNEEDWKNESLQRTGKPHIESLVERSRRERAERKIHAQPNPYIDDEAVPIGIEQPR